MEALKQFPKEFARSFRPSFHLLNNFNVRYLQDDQPSLKQYWRFFFIVPATIIHFISLSSHMVILLSNEQMIDFAYMLPPSLVCLQSILKAIIVVPNTAEISAIINDLGILWRTEFTEAQNVEKNALLKKLNFHNSVFYWVSVLGTFQYLISPMLETLFRRFVLKQHCDPLLPIAASYPFNPVKNWIIYVPVYMLQCYSMFLLVSIYTGLELLMITLCALIGAEFTMLKDDLSRAKPTLNQDRGNIEQNEYSIEEFVQRHQKVIRLSRQLDNVFNRMIFIDLLFVGVTTCAFSFAGEFARGPTYTLNNYIAVASSMLTVLSLCYFGELLTCASSCLGDVAYQNLWYSAGSHYKRATWLIIKISQKPCCLTSLRYAVVSLNLFTKVVSTTWSYFSLLNSVYNGEEQAD